MFINFIALILYLAIIINAVTHIDRIIKEEDIVSSINELEIDIGTVTHKIFIDIISLIIIRVNLNWVQERFLEAISNMDKIGKISFSIC